MKILQSKNYRVVIFAFAGFFVLSSMQLVTSQDWHQWGGPHRDFTTVGGPLDRDTDLEQIKELWRIRIGTGNAGICVRNDSIYSCFTENGQEMVVATSKNNGKQIWRRRFAVPTREFMDLEFGLGPHATPLVTENLIFCIGLTGRLSALDIRTGDTVWEKQLWENGTHTELERGCAASPVAFKDTIIVPVGGKGRAIRCYSMIDGTVIWQKYDFDCAYASPLIKKLGGRTQAIFLMDQVLVGLEPSTGNLLWNHPVPTKNYVNCTSPVVGPGDTIFINTGEGLRALKLSVTNDKFKVRESWASRITICQTTNFVLRDAVIYGAKEGGVFAAVDAETGRTIWQSRDLKDCNVAVTDDYFIAVQENGQVIIAKVTLKGIQKLWRMKLLSGRCWVGPVVANGLLLVRDTEKLIAFKLPP